MAKYEVIFSNRLDPALLRYANFLAQVSTPAVKRLRTEFSSIVKRAAQNPYQFPALDSPAFPDKDYRKALFSKWYLLIFYVDQDTIYLETVLDGRQNTLNREDIEQ